MADPTSADFNNLVRSVQKLTDTIEKQQPKRQDTASDLSQIGQSIDTSNISIMEAPLLSMSLDMKALYRGMSRYFGAEGLKVEGKIIAIDPMFGKKSYFERLLQKGPLTVNVENWEEIASGRAKEMRTGILAGFGGILGKFRVMENTSLVRALTIKGKGDDIRQNFLFKGIFKSFLDTSNFFQKIRSKDERSDRQLQLDSLLRMDSSLVPLIYINSNLETMKNIMIAQFEYQKEIDEDRRQQALMKNEKDDRLLNAMVPKEEEKKGTGFWKKILGLGAIGIGGVILNSIFGESALKGISKLILKFNVSRKILFKAVTGGFKVLMPGIARGIGKIFKSIGKIAGKVFGKLGGKAIAKTVSKVATKGILKVGGKALLKLVKKIPIVGLLLSIGFGVARIKQGDILGGVLEFASGIASVFPTIGTAISIGIDVFLAARDIHDAKVKKTGGKTLGNKIKDVFAKWLYPIYRNLPGIGGLIRLGEGIAQVVKGDVKGGLKTMLGGIISSVPVLGTILAPVYDMLTGASKLGGFAKPIKKGVSFVQKIWGYVTDWVKDLWSTIKSFVTSNILSRLPFGLGKKFKLDSNMEPSDLKDKMQPALNDEVSNLGKATTDPMNNQLSDVNSNLEKLQESLGDLGLINLAGVNLQKQNLQKPNTQQQAYPYPSIPNKLEDE